MASDSPARSLDEIDLSALRVSWEIFTITDSLTVVTVYVHLIALKNAQRKCCLITA